MIRNFVVNKYLAKEFFKIVINTSLTFFCLGFVLNLFEEINFFKDLEVGINIPIILSVLFVPSLLYNMFPFVILISGIWFFLKIKKTDEIIALKVSGISNFSIIIIPSIVSIILGILIITAFNPITSVLVKKYEIIKGSYEKDQEYLAAITVNGIWIKEKNINKNNIIRSSNLDNENLIRVTIYEFDKENNFVKRIEAKSANISSFNWILKDATIIDADGNYLASNISRLDYISMYDIQKIKSLYSNLDTISFWNLKNEIQLLEDRGYSTREMEAKFQRSFAFPFFLLSMVLLSGVFTLGMTFKENNWSYVFIAIITSVLIFYFNDFSAALGKTEKLPILISVWMPIVIIFIFSGAGVIHANQK
jgi:lipopolysaccharide export system permease protein